MVGKNRAINIQREPLGQENLQKLLEIILEVSHGSVTLIIQDGIVIQIGFFLIFEYRCLK